MNYDYIAKQETSYPDANFILRSANLADITYLPGQYEDSLVILTGIKSWFEDISDEVMIGLYKVYFPDFVLFNYSITNFLNNATVTSHE